jgi:very-short-patch-repair endonuclease
MARLPQLARNHPRSLLLTIRHIVATLHQAHQFLRNHQAIRFSHEPVYAQIVEEVCSFCGKIVVMALILRRDGKPRSPGARRMKRDAVNTASLRTRVKPEKLEFAARMLKEPTPAEEALAHRFKHSKLRNWVVRPQEIVLGYILDFYFPAVGVCVEVDGSHHRQDPAQVEWDKTRDRVMKAAGIDTIRVSNVDAINRTGRTVARIRDFIFEKAQKLLNP